MYSTQGTQLAYRGYYQLEIREIQEECHPELDCYPVLQCCPEPVALPPIRACRLMTVIVSKMKIHYRYQYQAHPSLLSRLLYSQISKVAILGLSSEHMP